MQTSILLLSWESYHTSPLQKELCERVPVVPSWQQDSMLQLSKHSVQHKAAVGSPEPSKRASATFTMICSLPWTSGMYKTDRISCSKLGFLNTGIARLIIKSIRLFWGFLELKQKIEIGISFGMWSPWNDWKENDCSESREQGCFVCGYK